MEHSFHNQPQDQKEGTSPQELQSTIRFPKVVWFAGGGALIILAVLATLLWALYGRPPAQPTSTEMQPIGEFLVYVRSIFDTDT